MFTDTGSLVYEIETNNYPQDSKFFYLVSQKVIGKLKDEFKGKIISESVGLNSRIYSLIDIDEEKKKKKTKGVNKYVVKNIKHKDYIDVLFNKKILRDKMKRIRSRLHKIRTYEVCFDDDGTY